MAKLSLLSANMPTGYNGLYRFNCALMVLIKDSEKYEKIYIFFCNIFICISCQEMRMKDSWYDTEAGCVVMAGEGG